MRYILIIVFVAIAGCQNISKQEAFQSIEQNHWKRANTQLASGDLIYYDFQNVTPENSSATAKELIDVKFRKNKKTEFYRIEISLEQVLPLAVKDLYEYEEIYSLGGRVINHYTFD